MKILFYSDSPWFSSGYGKIASMVLPKLAEAGIEIVIQAKFGHYGKPIELEYGIMYGATSDLSIETIPTIARAHKVDMVIMMCDIWAYDFQNLRRELGFIPIVVYFPLDTDFLPQKSIHQLKNFVDFIIPMSNHAKNKLLQAKDIDEKKILDTIYPPIPDTFRYIKNMNRRDLGFKGYDFVIGMVQMNKDIVRKDQARQIYAIKVAIERVNSMPGINKKVGLYAHMLPNGKGTGFDFIQFCQQLGIDEHVQFPIPSAYLLGFQDEQMAQIYNSIDVLFQCTSGEGFGMPTAEAMMCGTPVIGAMNSTTEELIRLGEDNYPIVCNELQYLAPAPSYIASFDEMVDTIAEVILNGIVKNQSLGNKLYLLVKTENVIYQWLNAIRLVKEIVLDECRVIPKKGNILDVNTIAISTVKKEVL